MHAPLIPYYYSKSIYQCQTTNSLLLHSVVRYIPVPNYTCQTGNSGLLMWVVTGYGNPSSPPSTIESIKLRSTGTPGTSGARRANGRCTQRGTHACRPAAAAPSPLPSPRRGTPRTRVRCHHARRPRERRAPCAQIRNQDGPFSGDSSTT
jgi:hypothetical protein